MFSAAAFGQAAPENRRGLDSLLRTRMLVPKASSRARQPLSPELWGCPLSLAPTGQGDDAGLSLMAFSTSTHGIKAFKWLNEAVFSKNGLWVRT